jgi:hypothetical protein
MADRLVVFLRVPRLGTVKTRLAAELGPDAALEIYRDLLARVLAALPARLPVELRFTPDDAEPEIRPLLRGNWTAVPQGPGDLGERLARAAREAFDAGTRRWVVVGTDAPEITAADLAWAFSGLVASEGVVGPAEDGGYWLLGLSRFVPELFAGIPWGESGVLDATESAARSAGLRMTRLRRLADIDTAADWRAWQRRLKA